MFSRIIIVGALLGIVSGNLLAQWQKISIPEIEKNPRLHAMMFKSGKLWVTTQDTLRMTSDDGVTWHVRMPEDSVGEIQAIDFFDDVNGIFATKRKVWRTKDGGMSWDTIFTHEYHPTLAAKFVTTPDEIAIGTDDSVKFYVTRNGGITWDSVDFNGGKPSPLDTFKYDYQELKDIQTTRTGAIRVLLLRRSAGGTQIATTRDYGKTWTFSSGVDYDCYSFAVDHCDSNLWYIINEEAYEPWLDHRAMFYRSTDAGKTWTNYLGTSDLTYFSGSLSVSPGNVIYLQTRKEGILRSVNDGVFWTNIAGPSGIPDTRLLAAVTDELVYAGDNKGQVWKTDNAGGFPGGNTSRTKLDLSKKFLFAGAFANFCADTLIDTLILGYPVCPPITFNGATIEGNIADYTILSQTADTVIVQFIPGGLGKRFANLVLTLNYTTKQMVPLLGEGYVPDFTFTPSISSVFDKDTILFCDSLVRGLRIRTSGCLLPRVQAQSISGPASFDYSLVTSLPSVLSGDDTVTILFKPRGRGVRRAFLTLRFEDNTVHSVPLVGYGVDPGAALTVSKSELFNGPPIALCAVIRDTLMIGTNACVEQSVAYEQISGLAAGDYTLERSAPKTLAGFDSVIVSFKPTIAGIRSATYDLVFSDSLRVAIPLAGRAVDEGFIVEVDPQILFEGDTATFCDTIVRKFVIHATGCVVPGVVSQTITGGNGYSIISSLPVLLSHDTVIIAFAPDILGSHDAAYELTLSDGSKVIVPLKGVASAASYALTAAPLSLFETDSLFTCESKADTIFLSKSGCIEVQVIAEACSGEGASDYRILKGLDATLDQSYVIIEFRPSVPGSRQAIYSFTTDDGLTISVSLSGFVKETIQVSAGGNIEISTDTVGGIISVPIEIYGLDSPQSVQLKISFDEKLVYRGSRSLTGAPIDIPGTVKSTSSRLLVSASEMQINGTIAFADFQIFPDSIYQWDVHIGELQILDAHLPCIYAVSGESFARITGPSGCEVVWISELLRTRNMPNIQVYPNPSSGLVLITSQLNVGEVRVEVVNQLGVLHEQLWTELSPLKDLQLNLMHLPSGLYYIRVQSKLPTYVLPLLIEQ